MMDQPGERLRFKKKKKKKKNTVCWFLLPPVLFWFFSVLPDQRSLIRDKRNKLGRKHPCNTIQKLELDSFYTTKMYFFLRLNAVLDMLTFDLPFFFFCAYLLSVDPPNFRAAQRFRKLVTLGNGSFSPPPLPLPLSLLPIHNKHQPNRLDV